MSIKDIMAFDFLYLIFIVRKSEYNSRSKYILPSIITRLKSFSRMNNVSSIFSYFHLYNEFILIVLYKSVLSGNS